jgi:CBS domain-containing protein
MKIGEFLKRSRQQLVTCLPDSSLAAIAKLMYAHGIGAMPVCEEGSCGPEDTMRTAQDLMRTNHFRHLPVIQDGRVQGMLSLRDTLALRLQESEDEMNLLRDAVVAARQH